MTPTPETGITPAVTTSISSLRTRDILDAVAAKKADAVLAWISRRGITPARVLIFGAYLTGAAVAQRLCSRGNVTIVDIHPDLQPLIDCRVDYFSTRTDLPQQDWDLVIDTTGLGGISSSDLSSLSAGALLVEDPCSDGSDPRIRACSSRAEVLVSHPAAVKGMLQTGGINAKTSGTMTLTMEVLRRAADDAVNTDGVLYSSTATDFFERILFKEHNYPKFRDTLSRPALLISALTAQDADTLLRDQLARIRSEVREPETDP
ncbi:MAG TPA: SAM-dependent methyltransferase HcgC family protein [Methanocorpusculum sp.]|nr:SAM-dependent methyltransferase HcgC family protein [Methanocorpusculum sp.]HJK80979.1 SAM-dependent methyltransferase HcgC family protein [Methanocorpusculum sp.]